MKKDTRIISNNYSAESADPKKVQWSGYGPLGNISQKPLQPTAEGAEEILAKYEIGYDEQYHRMVYERDALKAMQEFATLHAQRIAEKMVSERDDDVFDKMNCLIGYLERWLNNPQSNNPPAELRSVIDEAIEYLKSRDSHD